MNNNKSWWEEELDCLNQSIDDGKPISSSWRSKLGHWSKTWGDSIIGASAKTERLAEAGKRLASPANVVRNQLKGQERTLNIAWSDGSQANSPEDPTIYVSPDLLLDERKGTKKEEITMDGLTGQVLLAAAMKRTVSPQAWAERGRRAGGPLAKECQVVWEAMETAIARREILRDWQGWAGYFRRHAELVGVGKEDIQAAVDRFKPTVSLAASALAWNILNPADKVKLPAVYNGAMDAAAKLLSGEVADYGRYNICAQAVEAMSKALEKAMSGEPQPTDDGQSNEDGQPDGGGGSQPERSDGEPKPGEAEGEGEGIEAGGDVGDDETGEGGADQAGDSTSDGGDNSDGEVEPSLEDLKSRPEGGAPVVTDKTLFGARVQNTTTGQKELPDAVEVGAEQEVEIQAPSGLPEHHSTTVFVIEERNPEEYRRMVREVQASVNAIQAALRFRNNDQTIFNRGCTSGDLDEGSLDKLVLREPNPAIWERRELVGQPKVAVGILLDESGSMGFSEAMSQARQVCVAMAAALEKIKGVSLMLLGHSGDGGGEHSSGSTTKSVRREQAKGTGNQVQMYEYFTRRHKNPWAIVHSRARANNYDSFAMDFAVRKMMADYPDFPRRILFVVSDGEPAANCGYSGEAAMRHMRQVSEMGRRTNVGVYGVGINNAYSNANGELMYGAGNFVIIRDVLSSIAILTAFLRQVAGMTR